MESLEEGLFRMEVPAHNLEAQQTRELIIALQQNVMSLRNDTYSLSPDMMQSAAESDIQEAPASVFDYRKGGRKQEARQAPPQSIYNLQTRVQELESEVARQHHEAYHQLQITPPREDAFPVFGRGEDPPPEMERSYMHKSANYDPNNSPKYSRYVRRFVEYLTTKAQGKSNLSESQEKRDPRIIELLTEIFNALDIHKQGVVQREMLAEEISKNAHLARLFGVSPTEPAAQKLQHIGQEAGITLHEFLTFFQLSKNNLLTPNKRTPKENPAQAVKEVNKKREYNITVPQPFSFNSREEYKGESIRERRLKEMMQEKELEETKESQMQFKARQVPPEVIVPMYWEMLKEQQDRSEFVKQSSMARTKAQEQPFSFYYRDMQKETVPIPERPKPQFKANPVPWECTVPRYHEIMEEQKAAREQRHAISVAKSIKCSKMPPRMQEHAQRVATTPAPRQKVVKKTYRANPVPDFKRLQSEFQQKLDASKGFRAPIAAEPFSFTETRQVCKYADYYNDSPRAKDKWAKKKRAKSLKCLERPDVEPHITLKVKQMFELNQQKQQKAEQERQERKIQAQIRKEKSARVKSQVRQSVAIRSSKHELEERRALIRKAISIRMNQDTKNYLKERAEMEERVRNRPLLVEVAGDEGYETTSRLKSIRETLGEEYSSGTDRF